MTDVNVIVFSGHLVKDPELRASGNRYVARMRIANNVRSNNRNSNEEDTNYFDCEWFVSSENAISYLHKGSHVLIRGSARQHRWDQDGIKKSAIKMYIWELVLLSRSGARQDNDVDDLPRSAGFSEIPF